MVRETSDIWEGGRSTKLDFTTTLDRGNHLLELVGSEGCCDGTTRWSFQVNGGDWQDFTTENLNQEINVITIDPPEVIIEPEIIIEPEPEIYIEIPETEIVIEPE